MEDIFFIQEYFHFSTNLPGQFCLLHSSVLVLDPSHASECGEHSLFDVLVPDPQETEQVLQSLHLLHSKYAI